MKKKLNKSNSLLLLFLLLFIASCDNEVKSESRKGMDGMENMDMAPKMHKTKIFTCPMHPEIQKPAPGNCPICGMELVEKITSSISLKNLEINDLILPVDEYVVSSLKLIQPIDKIEDLKIKSDGYVTYNSNLFSNVTSRIEGRIDKLYVNYNFQEITKGQKLFEIYSPSLQTAQQNLLFLVENDSENELMINSAKQKLELLGMNQSQIKQLIKTKKINPRTIIYSNVSGYVIEEKLANSMSSTINSMGKVSSSTEQESRDLSIKEGMYLSSGETIFKVINYNTVWALLKVKEQDEKNLKIGNSVSISSQTNNTIVNSFISFIEPVFEENERFVSLRVPLKNLNRQFKIGEFISGEINVGKIKSLWIKESALIDLGDEKIVLIKFKDKLLKVKKIETGIHYKGYVQVNKGLMQNDLIAENAQFLMDSESFIKK